MMDTVLNLGLNDESVEGLAAQTGDERFAYDSYRRFISMYGRIVLDLDGARLRPAARHGQGVGRRHRRRRGHRRRRSAASASGTRTSSRRPPASRSRRTPSVQLRGAIEAVFQSWDGARAIAYRERERIPHDLGTAVNVQTMVFGNRDDNSGTGVGFTRNAVHRREQALRRLPRERPGRGRRGRHPQHRGPRRARRSSSRRSTRSCSAIFARLEKHYRDMCDTEFTIEQGKLWMLQTRVGKRTGAAALRMAVEMTKQKGWKISQSEALHARHRRPPRPGAAPAVRRAATRR